MISAHGPGWKSGKILIFDNDRDVSTALTDSLVYKGYEAARASSRGQAVEKILGDSFDLALIDVEKSGFEGIEVIRTLKRERPDLVTIAMISYAALEAGIEAVQAGTYGYIVKPLQIDQIDTAIQRALEHRRLLLENSKLAKSLMEANKRLKSNLIEVERTCSEATYALAATIDARDPYTRDHSEQVCRYAGLLGERMGLSSQELTTLEIASRLHDIGKIGVPDNILSKPSTLRRDEWEHVKRHPTVGMHILEPLEFLADVIPLVLEHHERYDGQGYPRAIRERNILLGSRILVLADSFDAMTSARPYRAALSFQEALGQIRGNSGTQFDPEVAELAAIVFAETGNSQRPY